MKEMFTWLRRQCTVCNEESPQAGMDYWSNSGVFPVDFKAMGPDWGR